MVSLWGSKPDGDAKDAPAEQPHAEGAAPSRSREPTERTRLLDNPPPPGRDGYLDPDDPAVSPYNLWTVRALRYLTVLFAMATFVWWVLLLVSIFVSPPGMNTPGSGFTDFSYTCLTLGILAVSLVFFTGPSRATRASMAAIAALLLVDMIVIAAVAPLRHQEGWVGIASIVWATLMAGWAVLVDRAVAWGKREEEERLTGRPETRRTLGGWLAVLAATLVAAVYIVIAVLMTATLVIRSIDAGLRPDGEFQRVDSGKYYVHLQCIGDRPGEGGDNSTAAAVTMLVEGGEVPSEGSGLEQWAYSAWRAGAVGRYCYWDRPGYAWSDDAPSPHSAGMSADALSEALARAGERGPWVSVSAGYGSVVGRIFAARHARDVAGLMLVDPLHEDLLSRVGGTARGFGLWGWGVLSPLGVQRIVGSIFYSQTREGRTYGGDVWQTGKFLKAKLQENLVAESLTRSEATSARSILYGGTPLVVVSSGVEAGRDGEWEEGQRDLTKLTDNLVRWDVVKEAPHEVWRTAEGRRSMDKGLRALVKAAGKA